MGFVDRHPAGQRVQRSVLRGWQHWLERIQVGVVDQEPRQPPDVRVDTQPGQVGIADVSEQPRAVRAGRRLQGGLHLPEGGRVRHLQQARGLVDADAMAGGVADGLVRGQDREQAVGVTAVRDQHGAVPRAVHPEQADPVVQAAGHLLQVRLTVTAVGEVSDRRLDGTLDPLVQLGEGRQDVLRDRQASHWLCPPLAGCPPKLAD